MCVDMSSYFSWVSRRGLASRAVLFAGRVWTASFPGCSGDGRLSVRYPDFTYEVQSISSRAGTYAFLSSCLKPGS